MPKKASKKKAATRRSGKKKATGSLGKKADTLSERLRKQEVARALQKLHNGEKLTREERSSLREFEREQDEAKRWEIYESIPQKHWREMSGRQAKTIKEQAERYGLPIGDRTISLPELARSLHDFLARNAHKLTPGEDDELLQGEVTPALEVYRREKAKLARLDRLEREASLTPTDEIHDTMIQLASILRGAVETIQRQGHPEIVDIYNEALDECDRYIEQRFSQEDSRINYYDDVEGEADA